MRKFSLYGIMTFASLIIRQFFLPNPFECFGDKAILINWIAEPIIQMIAYAVVGLFYVKGSAPALGSLGYLITYVAIVGLLWLCGIFSFTWWWILIFAVLLIGVIVCIVKIASLFDGR